MNKSQIMSRPIEQMRAQLAVINEAERNHWKSALTVFGEHRRGCVTCGNSNPLCGPHCATGRTLRNNAIDECAAHS